tara:strand:- start:78 stop:1622 length:1545 start_codon:yes stop_codon:yes gene_type:complete
MVPNSIRGGSGSIGGGDDSTGRPLSLVAGNLTARNRGKRGRITPLSSAEDNPLVITGKPLSHSQHSTYDKTRKDERLIISTLENVVVDSATSFSILDTKEAGELISIKIITDNPYAQVFLQIDDYRNKEPDGECPAELFYQGNLATVGQRRFKAIDGHSPSTGYGMVYEPDAAERYTNRIRLIVNNNIRATKEIYGFELSYSSKGSLPSPATPGHMGGSTFENSILSAINLEELSSAMTFSVGTTPYFSSQTYNTRALGDRTIPLAAAHPYIGIAGRPIFTRDYLSTYMFEMAGTNAVDDDVFGYELDVETVPDLFPGTTDNPSTMEITLTPPVTTTTGTGWGDIAGGHTGLAACPVMTGDSKTANTLTASMVFTDISTDTTLVGERFWFRNGGTVCFPGVITKVERRTVMIGGATADSASYDAGTAGGGFTTTSGNPIFAYRITCKPGLTTPPQTFRTRAAAGSVADDGAEAGTQKAHESFSWGILTTQGDTNPHILIKKVEVKRYKKVSFEG